MEVEAVQDCQQASQEKTCCVAKTVWIMAHRTLAGPGSQLRVPAYGRLKRARAQQHSTHGARRCLEQSLAGTKQELVMPPDGAHQTTSAPVASPQHEKPPNQTRLQHPHCQARSLMQLLSVQNENGRGPHQRSCLTMAPRLLPTMNPHHEHHTRRTQSFHSSKQMASRRPISRFSLRTNQSRNMVALTGQALLCLLCRLRPTLRLLTYPESTISYRMEACRSQFPKSSHPLPILHPCRPTNNMLHPTYKFLGPPTCKVFSVHIRNSWMGFLK